MAIVTLPLPVQLINGNVADGGQVMQDMNSIASNVNANAAKNGVNSDITALTAIVTINSGVSVSGWTITTSAFNGGTIDATTTGVTQPPGTNNTTLATTAFATALAFNTALPVQTGQANKFVSTDGTNAFWSDTLRVPFLKFVDQTDPTKVALLNVSAISTATTRTITMPNRDVVLGNGIPYTTRTSNTILASGDTGFLIDVTSGTFTQTFTAAATLGATWYVYYRNSGTGDITLDPNGGELIDGLTSYIMYPGEERIIICTGTAFVTLVLQPFNKTITTAINFIKPPGYTYFAGLLWGAGGSGANSTAAINSAGGGGGGACFPFTIASSLFAASTLVTIGAGGGAVAGANQGIAGGTSSIGSLLSSFGGGGGGYAGGSSAISGGGGGGVLSAGPVGTTSPGSTTAGEPRPTGLGGSLASATTSGASNAAAWGGGCGGGSGTTGDAGANGGNAVYGGGGGGGAGTASAAGGTSVFGGAGGAGANNLSASNGAAPGGGGGGTKTGGTSGSGARGECRIWGLV